jgi:hypothetical protein
MKTDRELIEEIHDTVLTLKVDFGHACDDLKEVRGEVFGNGKDGLKTTLANHITREDERGRLWRWGATTLGAVATILGIIGITKH